MRTRQAGSVILFAVVWQLVAAPASADQAQDLLRWGTGILLDSMQQQQIQQPRRQPPPRVGASRPDVRPAPSSAVAQTQSLLNELGYDAGGVDGLMGPRTQAAIRAFQHSVRLPVTGQVSRQLLDHLQTAAAQGNGAARTPAAYQSSGQGRFGGFDLLDGFDLPSGDYRSGLSDPALRAIPVEQCATQCLADARCQAFTFNARFQICILKATRPVPAPYEGAISGLKTEGAGGRPEPGAVVASGQASLPATAGAGSSLGTGGASSTGTWITQGGGSQAVAATAPGTRPGDAPSSAEPAPFAMGRLPEGLLPVEPLMRDGRLLSGWPVTNDRGEVRLDGRPYKQASADLARFLDLLALRSDMSVLEDSANALNYAKRFLSEGTLARYTQDCGAYGCGRQRPYNGWRGDDEFQREASWRSFVEEIGSQLATAAPAPPFGVLHVVQVEVGAYDGATGAFPLIERGSAQPFATFNISPLKHIKFDITGAAPKSLSMPRESAEPFVARWAGGERLAYLAIDWTLESFRRDPDGSWFAAGIKTTGARLYADPGLTTLLHDFGPIGDEAPQAAAPPSAPGAVMGEVLPQALVLSLAPELFDKDQVRNATLNQIRADQLALVSDHREDALFTAEEVVGRAPEFIADSLAKTFLSRLNERLATPSRVTMAVEIPLQNLEYADGAVRWKNAGPKGSPMLALGLLGGKEKTRLPPLGPRAVVQVNRDLVGRRAEKIPQAIHSLSLQRVLLLALDRRPVISALLMSPQQAERQWLPPSCPHGDNVDRMMQQGMSRDEAIAAVSDCDRLRRSWTQRFRAEFDVEVEDVVPVPDDLSYRDSLVLRGKLLGARVIGPHGDVVATIPPEGFPPGEDVWAQETMALNPKASDLPLQPLPNGARMTAEVVDLLQVRYLPDTMDDKQMTRMMLSRYEYETNKTEDGAEHAWGRFFPEKMKELDSAAIATLLPAFREWTEARAAALPEELTVVLELNNGTAPYQQWGDFATGNDNISLQMGCAQVERDAAGGSPATEKTAKGKQLCDFLRKAWGRNDPYLFLKTSSFDASLSSGAGRGPRYACGNDDYCRDMNWAKEEAGTLRKDSYNQPIPYRDLVKVDRLPDLNRDEAKDLGGTAVAIRVRVTGAQTLEAWPDTAWKEALRAAQPLGDSIGFGLGEIRRDEAPADSFVFAASVLGAELIDEKTGEVKKTLALADLRPLPTEMLEAPQADKRAPLDVLGISIGQSFAEAEGIVRNHLVVGNVLTADRSRQMSAIAGKVEAFSSGKLFVAEDESELIALFNEPPAAPDTVDAMWRMLRLPQGAVDPQSLKSQLVEKYGEPVVSFPGNSGQVTFVWSEFAPQGGCEQISEDHQRELWNFEEGGKPPSEFVERRYFPTMTPYDFKYYADNVVGRDADQAQEFLQRDLASKCGPVLSVRLTVRDQSGDSRFATEIVFKLLDQKTYGHHFAETLLKGQSEPAAPRSVNTAAPAIKF